MEFLFNVAFTSKKADNGQFAVEISAPQAVVATIYWADENGKALENYLPIKSLPLYDGRAKYTTNNIVIPEEAKTILCRAYNDAMLEIVLPEFVFTIPEEKLAQRKKPLYTIFAGSDMHFGGDYFHNANSRIKAFEFIKSLQPDMVVVSGDITDNSYPNEFTQAREYIEKHFPKTPVFVAYGNHDWDPYAQGSFPHYEDMTAFMNWQHARNESLGAQMLSIGPKEAFSVKYDGITVIALNPNEDTRRDKTARFQYKDDQLEWLDNELTKCDGDRYRIVMTHFHRNETIVAPPKFDGKNPFEVFNDDKCGEILDKHGDILHVSGHCHSNMDSEMVNAVYDPKYNVAYVNGGCMVWTGVGLNVRPEYYQQDRAMGQLVEIYEDYILVRGVEYVSGKYIPRCLHKFSL
jgi:hypothetical protein